MAIRYKDRLTGKYVSRNVWLGSRGRTGRYVRIDEKYGTGKRKDGGKKLPPVKPPIKAVGGGTVVERIRYQEADRHRTRDIEIISKDGKVQSVRIGQRVYTHRQDFAMLKNMIEVARIEGKEIKAENFRSTGSRKSRS